MTVQRITKSDNDSLYESRIYEERLESIFLQAMLKSMRLELHFLDKASPFGSNSPVTFQDLLDSPANPKKTDLTPLISEQRKNNSELSLEGNEFVKSLWPAAKKAASVMGLDPLVLIAQAALETGWGKSVIKDEKGSSSNNLFNIKGSGNDTKSVTVKTTEYVEGTPMTVNASFRKYESIEQSFHDYVALITGNERYQGALAHSGNPAHYIHELHKAGYATDPEYATHILSIYHSLQGKQGRVSPGVEQS